MDGRLRGRRCPDGRSLPWFERIDADLDRHRLGLAAAVDWLQSSGRAEEAERATTWWLDTVDGMIDSRPGAELRPIAGAAVDMLAPTIAVLPDSCRGPAAELVVRALLAAGGPALAYVSVP